MRGGSNWDSLREKKKKIKAEGGNFDDDFLKAEGGNFDDDFVKAEGGNFDDDDFVKAEGANFDDDFLRLKGQTLMMILLRLKGETLRKKRAARVRGCAAGINGTLLRNEKKHCDGHHFFFFKA